MSARQRDQIAHFVRMTTRYRNWIAELRLNHREGMPLHLPSYLTQAQRARILRHITETKPWH